MVNLDRNPQQLFSKRLTHIKNVQLIADDLESLDKTQTVKSKTEKEEFLYQAYVLHLVASWQVFIEELADYAIDHIVKKQSNERINAILKDLLKKKKKQFNTPNFQNINNFFKDILAVSENFIDIGQQKQEIKGFIDIRHAIAHTGTTYENLTKVTNFERMELFIELSEHLQQKVDSFLKTEGFTN